VVLLVEAPDLVEERVAGKGEAQRAR